MGNFENGNHAQKYKILSVVDDFKPRLTRTVTARERVEELKSWLWKFFKSGNIKLISLIFIDYSLVSSLFVPTYWSVVCGYIFYLAKVDAKSEVIRSVLEHQTGPFTFYQFEPKHETTAWNGGFYIKKIPKLIALLYLQPALLLRFFEPNISHRKYSNIFRFEKLPIPQPDSGNFKLP